MQLSFQPHFGSGVYSACNRDEYRKISVGKERSELKVDNLTAICEIPGTAQGPSAAGRIAKLNDLLMY
jgi:hypothetical protein